MTHVTRVSSVGAGYYHVMLFSPIRGQQMVDLARADFFLYRLGRSCVTSSLVMKKIIQHFTNEVSKSGLTHFVWMFDFYHVTVA